MNHIFLIFCIAAVSLIGNGKVNAESLIATWFMKDGPGMTIELQDQENFRMNLGAGSYILMSQGKGYMVSKEDGEWVAMSMESMKKMMEMSGIGDLMARMGEKHAQESSAPQFQKTGQVETIAGIKGEVYKVSMDNGRGEQKTVEMVFSDDARLVRFHQAQARWAESSGIMSGQDEPSFSEFMKQYANKGPGGAMLRYADVMKLETIQEATLTTARFKVPRIKEIDLSPIQEIFGKNSSQPGATGESQTIDLQTLIEKERMQRQAEIGEAEAQETKQSQDTFIKGVDSLLNGLSGILGN